MKKIFFITIIILILAAPITYFIILSIDKMILPYFPSIVIEGSKDAWITFFGTLFSGITTLIALIFTIKYENKKQIQEEIKAIRPFIITKPILKDNVMDMLDIENDGYSYGFSIRVENVSNNLVKDLQFVQEEVFEFNEKTKKYDLKQQTLLENNQTNYCIYTVLLDEYEIIAPHQHFNFQTNLIIDNYSESSKIPAKSFYVKVLLKYRDAMDKVEYLHQLEYEILINYSIDKKIHIFISNVRNKVIKQISIKKDNQIE